MMEKKTLGILGGMGPLASLAFLRTIYECNLNGAIEQEYPSIVLRSLIFSGPHRMRSWRRIISWNPRRKTRFSSMG
jgi:aspartate/glutamate racemase